MKIFIDGAFYDQADAKISVFDHGLLYGDGVFEGIRVYNGRVFLMEEHLDRLADSAKAILLKLPLSLAEIREATLETCRQNNLRDGYIRLVVTRGVGNLGLSPDKCPKATIFIIADTIQLYPEKFYEEGLRVVTVPSQRIPPAALSPAVKSLNYLNNIMAKIECQQAGAQEAIMLNHEGYVAECSGDNVFVVKKGVITTPPIWAGALGGLTRSCVITLAKQAGRDLRESMLTRYDLFVADEIFLTGTAAEVVPVVDVDGRSIGNGKPGPVSGDLTRRFRELTRTSGVAIYS
ncbi:branched chain amino acid aminotransferase apoenzyme [Verrucomicrobium sp. GAS474]|uniref:branched-chain-amino-acid transaminase n=1 Tax=Verrucomicrobium sp. GAS474 TaxID=1882831 RepID=UPI00087B17FD|nr:branched-chain-amino-acid transaminase [Verrucomicrobium sp. GAS474]SDU24303.1 branched chain amino acid aminotransferase apoenzyme [Verrucomicrobium sp. GAS474]